jgi:hypothetical protein
MLRLAAENLGVTAPFTHVPRREQFGVLIAGGGVAQVVSVQARQRRCASAPADGDGTGRDDRGPWPPRKRPRCTRLASSSSACSGRGRPQPTLDALPKNMISSGARTLSPAFMTSPIHSYPPWGRSACDGAVADPHRASSAGAGGEPSAALRSIALEAGRDTVGGPSSSLVWGKPYKPDPTLP